MAEQIPLKVIRTVGDTTALAEFEPTDTIPLAHVPNLTALGGVSSVDFNNHLAAVNPHSITTTLISAVNNSQVGANNGVASLDGSGKIPTSQIPAAALPEFKVVADATARLALVVQEGDEAKQLDDGSHWIFDGTIWHEFPSHDLPVYGTQHQFESSGGVSTTTSTTFQNKLTMVTGNLPLGDYMLYCSYGWNHDSAGNDFEARILVNGNVDNEIHKQEPKDSAGSFGSTGTSQRHYMYRPDFLGGISGVQTFELEYRTDSGGAESSIWEARFEFYRVA